MANIPYFDTLLRNAVMRGHVSSKTAESAKWLQTAARKINQAKSQRIERGLINDPDRNRSRFRIGEMCLFHYDPKHKDTLPFYDRFPLIFPIEKYSDGFLGINLHYLPPTLRAKLMDALYDLRNNTAMTERTRLRISYKILKSAAKYRYFKPCVKRYLNTHLRSHFVYINPQEWDVAMFLPLERFEKASRMEVWQDSRNKINKAQ